MRTALALLVGSVLLSTSAFAAWDDCGCSCPTSGPYYNTQQPVMRKTSDAGGSDGYFLKNGKVMVFRNGNISEINQEITLSNGNRLMADGTIIFVDGRRETLRDNQWLTIDGQISDSAAAVNRYDNRSNFNSGTAINQDGYFLQNGRVMMFRNGTSSQLTNETTLSNGTRIMADGTVISRDGTRSMLREGQRLDLEGRTSVNASHQEVQPSNTGTDRFNQKSNTEVKSNTTVPNQGNQVPTDSARPNDRSTTSPADVKKTETRPNDRSVPSTPHDSKTLDSTPNTSTSTPSNTSRPNDRSVPSTPQDSKTLDSSPQK